MRRISTFMGMTFGALALAAVSTHAQGANCQSGTGPVAGHATEQALATAAGASPNVCAFNQATNDSAKTNIKHVLLMDWSNGGHEKAHTQKHMYRLSRKYGFRLTRSQSNTYITQANIADVDVIVFNNGDQDPLSNATPLAAVRDFIEVQGKGMLAVHAALAFIPCPSENVTVASLTTCRWFLRAYRTQFWRHLNHTSQNAIRIYVDTVKAGEVPPNATGADVTPALVDHGPNDSTLINIFADLTPVIGASQQLPLNGGTGALAGSRRVWDGMWDEWYAFQNHPRRAPTGEYAGIHWGPVKMLLSIDESHSSYPNSLGCNQGSPCKTGDRPVSWTRVLAHTGLAAYNNAGHGDVYSRTRTAPGGTAVRDSMWEIYNWRLMKYLARDYVGCTNPGLPNYNAQASVRSITPIDSTPGSPVYRGGNMGACGTTSIWKQPEGVGRIDGIRSVSAGLRVPMPEAGTHNVLVARPDGRVVYARDVEGGAGVAANVDNLAKGYYFVRVTGADKKLSIARARVD